MVSVDQKNDRDLRQVQPLWSGMVLATATVVGVLVFMLLVIRLVISVF